MINICCSMYKINIYCQLFWIYIDRKMSKVECQIGVFFSKVWSGSGFFSEFKSGTGWNPSGSAALVLTILGITEIYISILQLAKGFQAKKKDVSTKSRNLVIHLLWLIINTFCLLLLRPFLPSVNIVNLIMIFVFLWRNQSIIEPEFFYVDS